VALDKSGVDGTALLARINEILTKAHESGVLTSLSVEWLDKDYTKAP
jgi:ABC-type amino acid transport substrate-binding protein